VLAPRPSSRWRSMKTDATLKRGAKRSRAGVVLSSTVTVLSRIVIPLPLPRPARQGGNSGGAANCSRSFAHSVEADVLEVGGAAVDALGGRGDPIRHPARLVHRAAHQRLHIRAVGFGRQPLPTAAGPFGLVDEAAVGCGLDAGEGADGAVKGAVRQGQ